VFKVMTWNVENLFRPGCGQRPDTKAVYQAKLQGLADMINSQTRDAPSVQGIGDPDAHADLVTLLDGSRHQHISTHPDQRHIRVAWLAPHGISDPEEIVSFPEHPQAVQTDDDGTTISEMGRGAVAIRIIPDSGETICP
jgi:hypothetical protein